MATDDRPTVCVFSPFLLLSVTVECPAGDDEGDEIHIHPAGQGFWIARMLRRLGERPVLVTALGGEPGRVLESLAPAWEVLLSAVELDEPSPAYVHDRRSGERRELARTRGPAPDRHVTDDLYGRVLDRAATTGLCVVTGVLPGGSLPLDFYTRLGSDLASTGVAAVADLHGQELAAFQEGGPLHTLKVSDGDLEADGFLATDASLEDRLRVLERLVARGAERAVLSSAERETVACFGERRLRARPPELRAVDHRGAGDAMTAGLVVAALHGIGPERTLQLACAAGAANVTRRGLGTGDSALVGSLADRVEVEELPGART